MPPQPAALKAAAAAPRPTLQHPRDVYLFASDVGLGQRAMLAARGGAILFRTVSAGGAYGSGLQWLSERKGTRHRSLQHPALGLQQGTNTMYRWLTCHALSPCRCCAGSLQSGGVLGQGGALPIQVSCGAELSSSCREEQQQRACTCARQAGCSSPAVDELEPWPQKACHALPQQADAEPLTGAERQTKQLVTHRRRLSDTIKISQSIKAAIVQTSPLPFELKVLEALLSGEHKLDRGVLALVCQWSIHAGS